MYLLDCCSSGHVGATYPSFGRNLGCVDAMIVKNARKCDYSALSHMDVWCFPDLVTFDGWNAGVTKLIRSCKGGILAYGHLSVDSDGCIDRIGVHPDYRMQGLGKQVLKSLISAARRQGHVRVYTHIHRDNASSLLMFLKAEFRTVGTVGKSTWMTMERLI